MLERCCHSQEDGSKTYYAFKVVGFKGRWGEDLTLRASEASYPGNEAMRNLINQGGNR